MVSYVAHDSTSKTPPCAPFTTTSLLTTSHHTGSHHTGSHCTGNDWEKWWVYLHPLLSSVFIVVFCWLLLQWLTLRHVCFDLAGKDAGVEEKYNIDNGLDARAQETIQFTWQTFRMHFLSSSPIHSTISYHQFLSHPSSMRETPHQLPLVSPPIVFVYIVTCCFTWTGEKGVTFWFWINDLHWDGTVVLTIVWYQHPLRALTLLKIQELLALTSFISIFFSSYLPAIIPLFLSYFLPPSPFFNSCLLLHKWGKPLIKCLYILFIVIFPGLGRKGWALFD